MRESCWELDKQAAAYTKQDSQGWPGAHPSCFGEKVRKGEPYTCPAMSWFSYHEWLLIKLYQDIPVQAHSQICAIQTQNTFSQATLPFANHTFKKTLAYLKIQVGTEEDSQ